MGPLYTPLTHVSQTYGGYSADMLETLITRTHSTIPKPTPSLYGGKVEIRRVVLSLKSGVAEEVKWALDVLTTVSAQKSDVGAGGWGVDLTKCEELVGGLCGVWETSYSWCGVPESGSGDGKVWGYEELVEMVREEREGGGVPGLVVQSPEIAYKGNDDGGAFDGEVEEDGEGVKGTICGRSKREVGREWARSAGLVFRNLSFGEGNAGVLRGSERFRKGLVRSLAWGSSASDVDGAEVGAERGENADVSILLENLKNAVIILSNISSGLIFRNGSEATSLLSVMYCFLSSPTPSKTTYTFPALETLAKFS
ncbi:hypothetical protein HK097_006353, partial [Rhizophlyctis rosea]